MDDLKKWAKQRDFALKALKDLGNTEIKDDAHADQISARMGQIQAEAKQLQKFIDEYEGPNA